MKRAPAKLARPVADAAAAVMAAVVAAMAAAVAVAAMAAAVEATAAGAAVDVATAAVANGAADRPRVCAHSFSFLQAGWLIPPDNSRILTNLRAGSLLVKSAISPYR